MTRRSASPAVPGAAWQRAAAGVVLELRVVPVLLWSFSAVTLGSALAWERGGQVRWLIAAWLIGVLLQGAVAHCVNDITDWSSGTDRDPAPRVLSGGSKVLRADLLTERNLRWMGALAAAGACALGVVVASQRGWSLLALGAVGVVGAVVYTLPPVAAAYVPFAGEAVAVACVWACAAGGAAVQSSEITWDVGLVGASHAAYCVSMLMVHHMLDRGPDERARPPKRTTIVKLGGAARRYGLAWAVAATLLAVVATITVDVAIAPMVVSGAVAAGLHLRVAMDDPADVTRTEQIVVLAGIASALATAVLIAPALWWVLVIPALVIPLDARLAARWL